MQKSKLIKSLFFFVLISLSASLSAASKKSIVCVSYPEYDWIMNILGENSSLFNVSLLQNNGTDLHSYQPSFKDIALISASDLFVYVGGESDEWVENALINATNKNMVVVNMMERLGDGVYEEEIVEGMEAEEEDEPNSYDDDNAPEYDEHIWLSLKNAITLTNILCQEIQKLDSHNAQLYTLNTQNYVSKLSNLDMKFQNAVNSSSRKTLIFGDRYPFRYLSEDYNLKYYAAFVGCSAETQASFKTIIFLANKIDELNIQTVLTIEKGDKKLARTIVSSTKNKNQEILEMDSLQSITPKDIKAGRTYLSAMEKNLEVLIKAIQ